MAILNSKHLKKVNPEQDNLKKDNSENDESKN